MKGPFASFETIVSRFQKDHPEDEIRNLRIRAALLIAFGEEADDSTGKVPDMPWSEWGARAELVLVQAGYLPNGDEQ